MPALNIKIYAGDSATQSIVRAQAQESISASDPRFDDFRALHRKDLMRFYEALSSCKEWRKGTRLMDARELYDLYILVNP